MGKALTCVKAAIAAVGLWAALVFVWEYRKMKKAEAALEAMPLYRWKKRMNGAARKRDRTAVGMPNDVLCAEKLCACVNILPISKKAKAEQK